MKEIISLNIASHAPRKSTKSEIGETGEDLAVRFLVNRGFQIVCRNFKIPIGRNSKGAAVTGEIDIVALDGPTLVFIEVKARSSGLFASPEASVTKRKQRQVSKTAGIYRRLMKLRGVRYRFDVVAVTLTHPEKPQIEHFPSFWTDRRIRPKRDELT